MPIGKPAQGGIVRRKTSKGTTCYIRRTSKPRLLKPKKPKKK